VGNPTQLDALRIHLEEVASGGVFKGSPRGQQFLRYVVEKSIEGDFDSLKERMIGIQLFRRPASYDTGEDAIVRVTASDVRRRLQQHYGRYGEVDFRIDLQPGSYIPEITYLLGDERILPIFPEPSVIAETVTEPEPAPAPSPVAETPAKDVVVVPQAGRRFGLSAAVLWLTIPLAILSLAYAVWVRTHSQKTPADQVASSSLPWSALLERGRALQIVSSDPDFATLQDVTGHGISLADYASGQYLPDSPALSPELRAFCLKYLRGTRSAEIDLPIVASIVSVANSQGSKYAIRPARRVRMADFNTDDDFVLLGSPIANPWVRFHFSQGSSAEWIEDAHPVQNEMKTYVPVAGTFESKPPTWATYAIVALVQNPHHRGHVLILAGVGAEGTAGAGALATNKVELANALHKCVPPAGGTLSDFELLLRVNVMNGSPLSTDVVACHAIL
jgi:hypothetical protein